MFNLELSKDDRNEIVAGFLGPQSTWLHSPSGISMAKSNKKRTSMFSLHILLHSAHIYLNDGSLEDFQILRLKDSQIRRCHILYLIQSNKCLCLGRV